MGPEPWGRDHEVGTMVDDEMIRESFLAAQCHFRCENPVAKLEGLHLSQDKKSHCGVRCELRPTGKEKKMIIHQNGKFSI